MRYIRTKDGSIWKSSDIETNSKDLWEGFIIRNNRIYEKCRDIWNIYKEQYRVIYRYIDTIVKQADTIEELCDEFVCDRKNKVFDIKPVLFNQDYDIQKEKDILLEKFEIYGAIWTDKGLIYVAKMNDKGEFELL